MKARVATLALVVASAFLFECLAVANPPQAAAPKPEEKMMGQKKKGGGKKTKSGAKTGKAMRGVPKGVQACLDHLIQMSSTDPITPYEGHPREIINNGLLWNDANSKCSIGTDAQLRLKVAELATAWSQKDAAKVRSLLQEIKSAAPQT